MPIVRPEHLTDAAGIHRVVAAAFPTEAEAVLIERLRASGRLTASLVAVEPASHQLIGHVAFSPVGLGTGAEPCSGLGLAPVAVAPEHQRRGVGSALIRAGLEACRAAGIPFVVVLGDPAYYRRFGFVTAADFGLGNEYGAHDEFMVLELAPGTIPAQGGLVRYAPEFAMFAE